MTNNANGFSLIGRTVMTVDDQIVYTSEIDSMTGEVIPKPMIVTGQLTDELDIPTIGIGCGEGNCDGEIAVITDVTGSYPWFVPPFATQRADVAGQTTEVFAFYASPRTLGLLDAPVKAPAVVLIHGGGGTAFSDWVWMWARNPPR